MKPYKYIVSLGFFCSPAQEFERIDRRSFSLPFDWIVSYTISEVMNLINNGFEGFLDEENLYQIKDNPQWYRNVKYSLEFYHDFSPLKSFHTQIDEISEKYNRRIARFYEIVKSPTLFLRYITEKDVDYLSENYNSVLQTLKKFNPQNEIVFVVNRDISLSLPEGSKVYYVEKDANDRVCCKFLNANDELLQYILDHVEPPLTKKPKQKHKYRQSFKKAVCKICLKMKLVYRHTKQCE